MHTYSICFQLFPFKHRLIADKTASIKVFQLRFACPVTVFVCDHCHFELETAAKPCQCPDCGKLGHIRTATAEESRAFQARKLEDVWRDVAPVLAG